MKKFIITAALTGAITNKQDNENVPLSPKEIADSAYRCYKAGASIVHIHARDLSDRPSLSYYVYEKIIKGIKEKCDVLICLSTSNYGIEISDEERLKLLDLDVDLATLTYGNLYRKEGAIINNEEYINNCLEKMDQRGILPEIEIFNEEMLQKLKADLTKKKILGNPLIQYIFGSKGGMEAEYDIIMNIINETNNDWMWSAVGIGMMQFPVNLMSIIKGSTVIRTGLEDNVYYERNQKANSNEQLVKRIVKFCENSAIKIASTEEAKEILGICK